MKSFMGLLFVLGICPILATSQQPNSNKKLLPVVNTSIAKLTNAEANDLASWSTKSAGELAPIAMNADSSVPRVRVRSSQIRNNNYYNFPGAPLAPFSSFEFKADTTGFLATFINLNDSIGDGIKIKLGKTHPMWAGGSYNSVAIFTGVYDSLINQVNQYIDGQDEFSADDLIDLIPTSILVGSVIDLTNHLIPQINSAMGLPISLDIPARLGFPNGLQLDILAAIGIPNGLSFDINDILPPRNIGPYGTPPWTYNGALIDFTIPSLPVVPQINIIPNAPPRVLIPDIGSTTVIPDVPPFTIVPAIPLITNPGFPAFTVPNFTLLTVPNSLTKENEFITFTDSEDRILGRIRAQSLSDWRNDYLDDMYMLDIVVSIVKLDLLGSVVDGSAGFIKLADKYNKIGVEYTSGHGDYAEWLERKNVDELIGAGDIVIVDGGKISKAGNGATGANYMVVSHKPIMLGNAPPAGQEFLGNKVAFMGQVPVKVIGPVCTGDFITPHPEMSGYGIAINPNNMTLEQFRTAVGRAWTDDLSDGFKLVNALVGIHNGDFIHIIKKNSELLEAVDARLKKIETMLNVNSDKKKPF